jgi:hypothetical protein
MMKFLIFSLSFFLLISCSNNRVDENKPDENIAKDQGFKVSWTNTSIRKERGHSGLRMWVTYHLKVDNNTDSTYFLYDRKGNFLMNTIGDKYCINCDAYSDTPISFERRTSINTQLISEFWNVDPPHTLGNLVIKLNNSYITYQKDSLGNQSSLKGIYPDYLIILKDSAYTLTVDDALKVY